METTTRRKRSRPTIYFLTLTFITTHVTGFSSAYHNVCIRNFRKRCTEQYLLSPTIPSLASANSLDTMWSDSSVIDDCSRIDDLSRIGRLKRRTSIILKRRTSIIINNLFPRFVRKTDLEDYEQRKQLWEEQFCTQESLRELFGENCNEFWGDLDAMTARRLYKTLLPRALLEMYRVGIKPEDLAPLAYRARLAAKLYVRERSEVPARVTAQILDGARSYKRYGKFQTSGMTYTQIWKKYEQMILDEIQDGVNMDDDAVTTKICLKILERSCETNERVDKWIFRGEAKNAKNKVMMQEQMQDLSTVIYQLEQEVQEILQPTEKTEAERRITRFKILRTLVRARRRLEPNRLKGKDIEVLQP